METTKLKNLIKEAVREVLKEELANNSIWPSEYLYKFIVPSDKEKVDKVDKVEKKASKEVKFHHTLEKTILLM